MSVAISSEHPRLAYTVHEGQGPYLILLHGFLSSQRQWLLNTAALSSICRPVTVDLYGHGVSPAPEDPESYTVDRYVAEIKHIQEQLGGEPVFLCGYSLGARFSPSWMEQQMFFEGAPQIMGPGMVFFLHMILMDSDSGAAMSLGRTSLVTETGSEPLSALSLELPRR